MRSDRQDSHRTVMQHLAYQPLFPTGNKYLQQKWDKASYDFHRRKVKSAKPTINTTPPETFGHLALKLKKQKLEEEWALKIQRENNILKEKISHIMRTTGEVDNRNYYDKKSLGKEKRQLELLRITKENQMILFRLSQCRPHYNAKSWHEDWLKTLKVMDSIARYPRGKAKQQKGYHKPRKLGSGGDKEQKMATNVTRQSPTSNKTNVKIKSEENEKKKERATSKRQEKGTEILQDTQTQPAQEPNEPEESLLPDAPENPDPSDTSPVTTDKHSVAQPLAPDGCEVPNTPHQQETTITEER